MIIGFSGSLPSNIDPDIQIRAYMLAAEGCRADAICSAAARFIRGEVEGHKAHRLPTAAEFAQECRSEHSAITARENRPRALPKPDEEINQHSPEHRMKMRGLIDLWKKAWAGDKRAQKALRPYGWRSDGDEHKEAAE